MLILIVLIGILVVFGVVLISMYNGLVQLRVRSRFGMVRHRCAVEATA